MSPGGTPPLPCRNAGRILTLLAALLLGACGRKAEDPKAAADAFFQLVFAGKFPEAYERGSAAFKFTRSPQYFEARARDLGLTGARSVEWGAPELQGRVAKIRGTFTKKDGTPLELTIALLLENDAWRLHEAKSAPHPKTGIVDDVFAVVSRSHDTRGLRSVAMLEPNALPVPSERELRQLAEDAILLFNEATQTGDFSKLYEAAADRWKWRGRDPQELAALAADPTRSSEADPFNYENRLTEAALRRAFAAAVLAKVDLTPVTGRKLILREPARVNSDGVLNLAGSFDCDVFQRGRPADPCALIFSLEFVNEASAWKLFGITVNIVSRKKLEADAAQPAKD